MTDIDTETGSGAEAQAHTPRKVECLETTRVYDDYYKIDRYRLRHELYEGGMSSEIVRDVLDRGQVAAVLPLDPVARKVVLIEQFRPGPYAVGKEPWMLECVAGILEAGETPEQLVRREALEEAGLKILDLHLIHSFLTSPGMSSETVALFCGRVDSRNAGGIHGLAAEGENIRVRVFTIAEAVALLDGGALANGKTIVALQWLALHYEDIVARWGAG